MHLGPVSPRQLVRRALFRGARIHARSKNHLILSYGPRLTTVPLFGDVVPGATVDQVQRDLGLDLAGPVKAIVKARPIR